MPPLDDGFHPVAAVVCGETSQRRPTGGSDLVAVEDRADDVAAVVAALRLPDERPTGGSCTFDLVLAPWMVLLDAQGRWVRPGVPVDRCGKPRAEFHAAFAALRTTRVATRVLEEIESDAAAASGCDQGWADMVWVAGEFDSSRVVTPGPLPADNAEVRVCVYGVPASERGSNKPAGDFESGGTLPADRWRVVRRELAAAGPAAPCRTPSSRFAVLHPPAGEIYVEADGCRRVLIETGAGPGALRRGTAALRSAVFKN